MNQSNAETCKTSEDPEITPEETFYGKFRSIVKQRFFGLKLEEEPFMEFLGSEQEMKDKLEEIIAFMGKLKISYVGFLKKTYPQKIEKRKKKRKAKKKKSPSISDLPKDSAGTTTVSSGVASSNEALSTEVTWQEAMMFFPGETLKKEM